MYVIYFKDSREFLGGTFLTSDPKRVRKLDGMGEASDVFNRLPEYWKARGEIFRLA